MFMPVYNFTFPGSCAGQAYTVRDDSDNSEVASGTLGSASNGAVVQQETLDEGNYTGRAYDAATGLQADSAGTIDLVDSFGGGVGASETAYFVATGPAMASDGNNADTLTFIADDRHDALPSWVSLIDGNPTLGADAGTCAFSIQWALDFDFTNATGVTGASGSLYSNMLLKMDGVSLLGGAIAGAKTGDGQDVQSTDPIVRGDVIVGSTFSAVAAPFADEDGSVTIDDGVVTPRCALTITRIAQAAVLPD